MQIWSGTVLIWVLAVFASLLIRLFKLTWRVKITGLAEYNNESVVFCFYHGEQAAFFAYPHKKKVVILSSLSRDGTLQAHILRMLGFHVERGSSSKGGFSGLKSVVKAMKKDMDAAFAVDGSKGPYQKSKPGAIGAAKLAGAKIVPLRATAQKAWVFEKSWDKYTLPKPFSKISITAGEPIDPQKLTVTELDNELAKLLKNSRPF
ncbi:MAG: DUF374 domain-containing protein [Deltaproteobacteria bacterium]|nr:DUF374 domain-containing protein [Deltaproteobacteria bacterium]